MKCAAARALIDNERQGNRIPGRIDDLALHLASCDACRTYRTACIPDLLDDQTLLSQLLQLDTDKFDQDLETANQVPYSPNDPSSKRQSRSASQLARSLVKYGLLSVTVVVVLAICGVALALATIRQNVQAIIVATPTAGLPMPVALVDSAPSSSPPTAVPTSTPSPVASPIPQLSGRAPLLPTLLPTTQLPYPPQSDTINILLLGSDLRPDETGNARTDTVLVARIDPARQRVALLSLPRDLIVSIPGYGQARINSANTIGGVDLVRSTVSNLLGIPIDYYATINFEGFIAIVDAVGGIDVNVETELYDPQYPTMDYGYTEAHFLPGVQHMDGATALMYSRIRHPDSDYDRIKRQQAVLLAIGTRLQEQNAIQSLQSLVTISGALRGYVQTDMPEDTMLGLAWSMQGLSPAAVERYSLGANDVTENVIPGDPYASFALPGAIETLVQQFLGANTP